jgi:hypothetical protein
MATGRWHLELAEESEPPALVPWRPRPEPAADEPPPLEPPGILALLTALRHLAFRGVEPRPWATPLSADPIAFLLDTVGEAVSVWTGAGELLYSNHAAADLQLGPPRPGPSGVSHWASGERRFERRGLAFDAYGRTYVLEIVRELPR